MYEFLKPKDGPVVEGMEAEEVVYAKDQPEYIPLRTLQGNAPRVPVLSRWTLTTKQRELIANGADIYLEINTFINRETGRPNPLQPIRMAVSDGKLHNDWVRVCLLDKVAITPIAG